MDSHKNNIGALRLLFASLVIIGHAPEMIDGNRAREPLTVIFHTVSLGELSVDAFFLLSGYLITRSVLRSGSLAAYLARRVMRIYPAFIVAYLLSVFVLGPLVGAEPWLQLPATFLRMLLLHTPIRYPNQFPGLHVLPGLNSALWTIGYEFRCYLLLALLHGVGLLTRRAAMLVVTSGLLLCTVLTTYQLPLSMLPAVDNQGILAMVIGVPVVTIRLTSIFLVGLCVYLFRTEIAPVLNGRAAVLAGVIAAALLYRDPHFAEAGLVTIGAIPLFWLALRAPFGPLQRLNDKWDISYGTYLYGWPIATYLRWRDPAIPLWQLAVLTLALALILGAFSWWGLEKWTKDLGRNKRAISPDAPSPNPLPRWGRGL